MRLSKKKIGRNELCPCGSGFKYKKCCLNKNINTSEIKFQTPKFVKMTEKERQLIEKNDPAYQTDFGKEIMKKLKRALKEAKSKTELPKRFPSDCIIYVAKEDVDDLNIEVKFDFDKYESKKGKKKEAVK